MDSKRYPILDSIRGLVLISMIVYHTVWDMVYIFGEKWSWYKSEGAHLWQQSICWAFILLSGFCWAFGRKKWKRGVIVFVAGMIISLVTSIFMPQNRVLFGVLTLLGSCMLLMIPLEKVLKHVHSVWGVCLSFVMFLFLRNINDGYLGFGDWQAVVLPESWYVNWFTAYWGFPARSFASTDYFSILPWIFLFITGYFLHRVFQEKQWLAHLSFGKNVFLEKLGKHSLVVYMLHQPLVYGALFLYYNVISGYLG